MIHLSTYHSNGLPRVVWSNKVNLIGEKVYKPKIHFCERCSKPILIYGRLIPCKHVFCYTCANLCINSATTTPKHCNGNATQASQSPHNHSNYSSNSNQTNSSASSQASGTNSHLVKGCHRCSNKVLRVERNTLNSIFVCQVESCKRTYLSARDLQAHVAHRHTKKKQSNNSHHHTSIYIKNR